VETFRTNIGGNSLVGSYLALTNQGCLVHPKTSTKEQGKNNKINKTIYHKYYKYQLFQVQLIEEVPQLVLD
jgi:hypothetical protein